MAMDLAVGRWLYDLCRRQPVCKALADLTSLSGDEMVWYLLPAPFITFGFARRLFVSLVSRETIAQASCLEEIGCDLFGTCGFCLTIEVAGKLLMKRPRPPYCNQNHETYVVPGEKWSMPSGHSIRAGVLAFWLAYGKNSALICSTLGVSMPRLEHTVVWAACVCVSRVAKGRHFPTDTMVGYALGISAGYVLEGPVDLSNYNRGVAKVVGGIVVTGSWGYLFLCPVIHKATKLPMAFLVVLYFVFYITMLVSSVPRTEEGWNFGACGHDVTH